jgi:glucosamine-6-phosphate deaminase
MLHNVNGIKIFVEESYEALSKKAAEIIAAQVKANPASVLGLATGSTPLGTYKELAALHKAGLDFSSVSTFNLDEYYPIAKANVQSYDYFMHENLFSHINIAPENIHIPSGEAKNTAAECSRYEAAIQKAGGINLQLLGIGNNGHIGFNEPESYFAVKTFFVELDNATISAKARFFESSDEVPRHALTMGIGTIMKAESILLLASGSGKADIIRDALIGQISPLNPASVLQLHRNVTVVLDKAAAKLLEEQLHE